MIPPLKIGERLEISVNRLSFTGKGIGRHNNFVIFIPHTLPGDRVLAEISMVKRRYADARAVEYLEHSPQATQAPCRHFGLCGGCSFQNLPYQLQLQAKREALIEHLRRIAGIENPPVAPILPSEHQLHYRNKMEFSFKPDAENHLHLGLHYRDNWECIFDVEECLLQSQLANRIVTAVREFFIARGTPAYHLSEHHGYLRFLTIRQSLASGEAMVVLVTNEGEFREEEEFISLIKAQFPEVVSIARIVNKAKANIATGEPPQIIWGKNHIAEEISGRRFKIGPATFFQTNSGQIARLYNLVADLAELDSQDEVLDLYTGCGAIAIHIAERVKSVLGIELNGEAVKGADENARLNGIANCRFEVGDVGQSLSKLNEQKAHFDTIIVDPPRAGLTRKVISRICRLKAGKIIYVSCNPATLAGNLRDFGQQEYALRQVVPVDMFPHTFHIESVSRLDRTPTAQKV